MANDGDLWVGIGVIYGKCMVNYGDLLEKYGTFPW